MNARSKYVLITPARNEESYIEKTLKSVTAQIILPEKWVIVSDGSTDRTDEIVRRYSGKYDFIELLRVEPDDDRNFGAKVNAIRTGYERLASVKYNFLGNLDADISFGTSYYQEILEKFAENPKLGIAGGRVFNVWDGKHIKNLGSLISVGGQIQLFRRECYEEIGGYIPLRIGGEDAAAEVMARMRGWEVRSFPEIKVLHHRRTGTEGRSIYAARFVHGQEDYSLGYHPLFFILKCIYRVIERPYFVGSLLRICGFSWSLMHGDKRYVSSDFVEYLRREQMHRLWSLLLKSRK